MNRLHTVVNKYKSELVQISRLATILSMHQAWSNCKRTNSTPQEPDFVASLVINLTKQIGNGWRPILRNYGVDFKVSGIYCHQTPKVHFQGMNKSSCELGDLLWCFFHRDQKGNEIRNAILFQAKCSSSVPMTIKHNEYDQLELYSKWPEFKYVKSGHLNGEVRKVKPSAPRQGAQYLTIDDRPAEEPESGLLGLPNTYPIGCCIAQNPMFDHTELGIELVNFLSLTTGNAFDSWEIAKHETGWSRTVWDLIQSSAEKAFRRTRSGFTGEPRLNQYPLEYSDGSLVSTSNNSKVFEKAIGYEKSSLLFDRFNTQPPENGERQWFDEEGSGVSIIIIESDEIQSESNFL